MHQFARAAAAALCCAIAAAQVEPTGRFRNRNQTFELDLPADWRQPAPDEVREQLRSVLPDDLHRMDPYRIYAVGPVDRWLRSGFDGVLLQVVEGDQDWDEFASSIETHWQSSGAASRIHYELSDIHKAKVGPQQLEVIECVRHTVPEGSARPFTSLDVYAPPGGRTLLLAFRTWDQDFTARLPELQRWADSLTFASNARTRSGLTDRLLMPVGTGLLVGALLLWLYRRNRRGV
jgi:hypothetical protein